jgi:hypothetical protein
LIASLLFLIFVRDFPVTSAVAGIPFVAKLVHNIPAAFAADVGDPAVADFIASVSFP